MPRRWIWFFKLGKTSSSSRNISDSFTKRYCVIARRTNAIEASTKRSAIMLSQSGQTVKSLESSSQPLRLSLRSEMEELIGWVQKAIREEAFHPLSIVAIFIVKFLAIHPFQDGNGRLSRVLTTLMLLRAGYAYVPYASLESVVEENKGQYYKALRRTQKSLDETLDWGPWVGFFLRALKKQKQIFEGRVEDEREPQITTEELHPLSEDILRLFENAKRLKHSEIVELTNANRNTMKVRLRELVKSDHLEQHGKARATWYSIESNSVRKKG